jgi:hypothetical protein
VFNIEEVDTSWKLLARGPERDPRLKLNEIFNIEEMIDKLKNVR